MDAGGSLLPIKQDHLKAGRNVMSGSGAKAGGAQGE